MKVIKEQRSFAGSLIVLLAVLLISAMFGPIVAAASEGKWLLGVFLIVALGCVGWDITRNIQISRTVKKRAEKLALMDAQNFVQSIAAGPMTQFNFMLSSLDDKRGASGVRNIRYANVVNTREWAYADFSYDIYRKTKNGEYRDRTVYYSVITTKLGRSLPHVFFDSYKARRRQFRYVFSGSQIQSLEGDFDKHFVTYFPAEYHIDGRSLITPEVMQALIEADDYDIEVVGDQVFLFGDLRDPEAQLKDMSHKIAVIKDKLLHNTGTYRDENIPYAEGRKRVSDLGASLAINLTWPYIRLAVGMLMLGSVPVLLSVVDNMNVFIIYLGMAGIVLGARNFLIIRKELERRSKVMAQYKSSRSSK